jgi:parvulin-like peptidyl-prolyl isomerase
MCGDGALYESGRILTMRESMQEGIRQIIIAALLLLVSAPGFAADPDAGPADVEASASSGSGEEVLITLQAPLGSPLFSNTPVAVVNDEPITFGDLTRSIASSHTGRTQEATAVRKDYASLLKRIVSTKLIVQEARNIGLDELPEIEEKIDKYSTDLLISSLMAEQLSTVEPDPAEVTELYERMSREFLLGTVTFKSEDDALLFKEQHQSSGEFKGLAERFVEEGRAEVESGGEEYLKLKDLLPRLAQAAYDLQVGSVSEIFQGQEGLFVFHVEEVRFYEDPEVKEEARKIVLGPLMKKKGYEYGEFLEAKHATVDEKLLDEVDFKAEKTGFLWFQEEKAVDYQELLDDERVLATVHGDEPISVTVGDVAGEVKNAYFHGIEKPLERGELNEKKRITLKNMVFKETARLEAQSQGIHETEGYRNAVEEYTSSLLFDTFVERVVVPDVEITEGDARQYYSEHGNDFTSPKMLRVKGLAFRALPDAERALGKLRRGADFRWVSANSPGQVDKDTDGVSDFDQGVWSVTGLPAELRKEAKGAKRGDSMLYSGPAGFHYVLAVEKVFPPQQEAYEVARQEIAEILFQEKVKDLIDDWSEKLKEAYETRIFVTGPDE